MDPVLAWAQSKQDELIVFLRELVECESPTDDALAVSRFVDLLASRMEGAGTVRVIRGRDGYGPHLLCKFSLPGRRRSSTILALGHSDTVYSSGTLKSMPFRKEGGRVYGPGVFDMKGGLAIFLFAMRALRELDLPVQRSVLLQVNSDEEMGSPTSRTLTEENARKSIAVLVMEPAAGRNGDAKTARKGVGDFRVRVRGRAAHAGLDFASGASAVVELSYQISRIAGFTEMERGLTVNPGVIGGGTRANVVAEEAWCDVDVRVTRAKDWGALEKKFRGLTPVDKRCTLQIEGEMNRPPMERTRGGTALYRTAREVASKLGIELRETAVGGGSDGNFTAALGIPTLDGMGAVGEGAHTPGEYVLASRIPDRVALLARLVQAL